MKIAPPELFDGQELAGVSGYLKEAHQDKPERSEANFPPVLDVCCGARMFWFDKSDRRALFVDKRSGAFTYKNGERQRDYLIWVNPDVIADFTALPFPNETFPMVVFDPPHFKASTSDEKSYTTKKYGRLPPDWRDMLAAGFRECFRVLKQDGALIFKWCEYDIPVAEIVACSPVKPLFGNRYGKAALSHWIVFIKHTGAVAPAPLSDNDGDELPPNQHPKSLPG